MYYQKYKADFVIIGAGSAGCVLANRLSANPDVKVILLEAGSKDSTWKIHMPAALMYNLATTKYNWYYHTEPQSELNNRVIYWPRGKVWGGSSSLNAMVFIRGHAKDFERWQVQGADGWAYKDVLPYFKKMETCLKGGDYYRGDSGPLFVRTGPADHPLHQAFIRAGVQAGYKLNHDINGAQQEGFGQFDSTIKDGQRWSSSKAYLRPVSSRKNLTIVSNAHVSRVIFNNNTASGVEFFHKNKPCFVGASSEVILSAGAVNSAQLLLLSGVGDSQQLREHDIAPVVNLPGVGQNLQDHLELYIQHYCKQPVTLYNYNKFPGQIYAGLRWFFNKTGPCASSHLESGAFVKSSVNQSHPNIQLHFLPSFVSDHGRAPIDKHAFQVHVGPMRPLSRGSIKLRSVNPFDAPIIQANYLKDKSDLAELREAIKIAREVFTMPAFDKYRGDEILPGPHVTSDLELDNYIRQHVETAYHPSCTCKMGKDSDPLAVVDNTGKVYGVNKLRVVDASIMPSITSGNLNAPVIMMAEKIADAIILYHK